MSTELLHDNAIWKHKKQGYTVKVEHSQPHGVTTFRREIPLQVRTTSGKIAPIAVLRTKKTHYFLYEFEKA